QLGEEAPLTGRDQKVREALAAEERAGVAARRKEVVARLRSRVQKLRRTLAAVEEDAARAARAGEGRSRAELLLRLASRLPRGVRGRGAAPGRDAGDAPDATDRKEERADPPALSEIHVANGRADPDRPQRARQRCAHAARRARQRPLAARPRRPGSARDRARRR